MTDEKPPTPADEMPAFEMHGLRCVLETVSEPMRVRARLEHLSACLAALPEEQRNGVLEPYLDDEPSDLIHCPDCYDGGACLPGGCGVDGCERCGKDCPTCGGSCEVMATKIVAQRTAAQLRAEFAEAKLKDAEAILARAQADNRSLNDRLYTAIKDAGEAEADSSFALQALASLRTDEADEKLIDEMMASRAATRKERKMVPAEALELAEAKLAEAERQNAELRDRLALLTGGGDANW